MLKANCLAKLLPIFSMLFVVVIAAFASHPPVLAQNGNVYYAISLQVVSSEVLWGNPIIIDGLINSTATLPIKVSFYEYYKDILEYYWITAQGGVFHLEYKPSTVGYWRISATVQGAEEYSVSNTVEVVVKYSSTPAPVTASSSTVGSIRGLPVDYKEYTDRLWFNFTMFIMEFYKSGYEMLYSKNGSVLVYYHSMVLQYYNDKVKDWRQAGTFTSLSWVKVDDWHYQVVKYYQDSSTSPKTNYTITYDIRSDSRVKITIRIESGADRQYRLQWSLDGIVYSDWAEKKNADGVKMQLLFGDENVGYGFIKVDWQDVYEQFKTDISSYSVSTSQGRKADVYFTFPNVVRAGEVLTVDPSLVGTGGSTAILYSNQRKTFYANGRFWVFYSDGANMVYKTSTDGVTWSSATAVRAANYGHKFSVWFDGTYLHYAYAGGGSIYYRRGTPNADGSITWSAAEQTVSTTYNIAYSPFVSVDSNGYVWIGYHENTGSGSVYPFVIKSGNNDGTWGTTPSGFPYQLSTTSDPDWFVTVVPLTAGKMLVIYDYGGATVKARCWTGSAWSTEVATTSAIYWGEYHSVVAQGDDAHVVFLKKTTYDIIYTKYSYSTNSFSAETTLKAGATSSSAPVISKNPSTNDLYVFWAGSPTANHFYYRKYNAASTTWETAVDWIAETETLTGNDYLTCFYQAGNNGVGLAYMTGTSPYNVKFAYLQLNSPPTIGGFQAPATVYANKFFLLNATINDANGVAQFVNATVELSNGVILKWDNATNTFSKYQDAYGYCTLDSAGSFKTQLNTTAYKLTWKIKFAWNYPEGYISILATNTKVFDSLGDSGSNSYTNLCYFEDDLIVYSASVDDGRVNPNQKVTFSGKVYYEGTTTPASASSGLSFDGVDDYVRVPAGFLPTNAITVCMWVKADSFSTSTWRKFINTGPTTTTGISGGQLSLTSDSWILSLTWDGRAVSRSVSIGALVGVWKFVAIGWDGNNAYGGVNGAWSLLGAGGTSPDWAGRPLTIGANFAPGEYFAGVVDEVRIYNRALTADEIKQNYYATLYGNTTHVTSGLVLELTTASINGSTWKDTSGYNNHGTIYGATAGIIPKLELNGAFVQGVGGFVRDDGTFTLERVAAPNTVGLYSYNVYTVTDQASVQNKTVNVIVDRIMVSWKSDARINVGSQGEARFKLASEYDGTLVSSGNVWINGTAATWDSANAWWKLIVAAESAATRKWYIVTAVNWDVYGITALNPNVSANASSVTWDRVVITAFSAVDSRINVGATAEFIVQGIYEYDNSPWSGSVTLNDTTTKNTVGRYGYKIISIIDNNYGLTAFVQSVPDVYVVWDRINVFYVAVSNSYVNVNETVVLQVKAKLEYDGHMLGSGDSLSTSVGTLTWDSTSETFKLEYASSNVGKITWTIISGYEATFNITAVTMIVEAPSTIWDQVKVLSFTLPKGNATISTQPLPVRVNLIFEYSGSPVTSGTVSIQGFSAYSLGSGVWEALISSSPGVFVVDTVNVYSNGIHVVNMNGQTVSLRFYLYYYNLTFNPLRREETGELLGAAEYRIVFEGNSWETVVASSTINRTYTDRLILYVVVNGTRQYWMPRGAVNYIFSPVLPNYLSAYTVNFIDYSGLLTRYRLVELQTVVNGSRVAVERRLLDAEQKCVFYVSPGKMYTVIFVNLDNAADTYVYGDVTFTGDLTLRVKAVFIPSDVGLVWRDVQINIVRKNETIEVDYLDKLGMTISVHIQVKLYNGTVVAETVYAQNSFVYTFVGNASLGYIVNVQAEHLKYGRNAIVQCKVFPPASETSVWNFNWLGNWQGLDSSALIPAALVVFAASAATVLSAPVGAFLAVVLTACFSYMGWLPVPSNILVVAFALTVLMAISYAKRRVIE